MIARAQSRPRTNDARVGCLLAQRLNIRSYAPEDGLAGAPVWRIFQDERGVCGSPRKAACSGPSTTSAPATRRSATCISFRSTFSRSISRSCGASVPATENTEIIRTIMSLASSLGMRVVAEGIETREQLDHLRGRGCDFGQGYYFSHPVDEATATELIRAVRAGRSWRPRRLRSE